MSFLNARRITVTTAALTLLTALTVNAQAQTVFLTDVGNGTGSGFTGSILKIVDNGPLPRTATPYITGLQFPIGIVTGPNGDLYFADPSKAQIDEVSPNLTSVVDATFVTSSSSVSPIKVLTGGAHNPYGIAFNSAGDLFYSDNYDNSIYRLNSDSTSTLISAGGTLSDPTGIVFGTDGTLYVANGAAGNNTISAVNITTGTNSVYATGVINPNDVKLGPDGALYAGSVAQPDGTGSNNKIFRISNNGTNVSVYAQGSGLAGVEGLGFTFDNSGNLFATNIDAGTVSLITPNSGGTTGTASLYATGTPIKLPVFVAVAGTPEPSALVTGLVAASMLGAMIVVRRRKA